MKKIATFLALSGLLIAQENDQIKTPEQIQAELDQAQRDFDTAKKMFNPYYTGPLITGSANNAPKGKTAYQVYGFFQDDYARFDDDRVSRRAENTFIFEPLGLVQRGLTDWLDITVTLEGFVRHQNRITASSFGDVSTSFGIQLLKQTPWRPSIRFTVGEIFPSGKFKNLNPDKNGLDAGGAGIFATTLGFFIGKVFWENPLHPFSLRAAATYEIPNTKACVRNLNAYGGTIGTDGKVNVGAVLNLDAAIEYSFTQKWAFALDIAYSYQGSSTFSGFRGFLPDGTLASVGGPSNDNLSIAPAIEYSPDQYGGFIGGLWFSLTGRNSSNFVALVLSYTHEL